MNDCDTRRRAMFQWSRFQKSRRSSWIRFVSVFVTPCDHWHENFTKCRKSVHYFIFHRIYVIWSRFRTPSKATLSWFSTIRRWAIINLIRSLNENVFYCRSVFTGEHFSRFVKFFVFHSRYKNPSRKYSVRFFVKKYYFGRSFDFSRNEKQGPKLPKLVRYEENHLRFRNTSFELVGTRRSKGNKRNFPNINMTILFVIFAEDYKNVHKVKMKIAQHFHYLTSD